MNYVVHYCHNKHCNNCWLDEDLTNAKSLPPTWKYCLECVSKGFVNPEKPPLTDTQKQKLKKMQEAKYNKNN